MVEAVVQRSIQWKDMEGSGTRRAAVCIPASLFVAATGVHLMGRNRKPPQSLQSPTAGNGKERAVKAKFLTPDFKYSLPWKVWF